MIMTSWAAMRQTRDDSRLRLSPQSAYRGGVATTSDTIRRTSGKTASSVGNATSQDNAHAPGQVARKAGVGPRLRNVEIIDTTKVIKTDKTSGITTGA